MSKNIIVFSDGTGQEGGKGHNTNIYKLFNMIEDRTSEQIAFYDRGLGTGWRKITGKVGGMGISKNIMECYEFIFENYTAGDHIYLFGFSRGAATVRSLSGFIHLFGILPKSRPELIRRAYKIYKIPDDDRREKKAEEFIDKHHTMWCRIRFLGVWDTVAALGIPFKSIAVILDKVPFFRHRFHNFRLSPSVENAYHALALDEERLTFHPVLWDREKAEYQTMKQVWFCGVHTDVGGGYKEQELSDIPLVWIIQMAVRHGLKIYPKHNIMINQDINGIMHDSRKDFPKNLFRKKVRFWNMKTHGKPTIHESVLERKLNKKNVEDPPYKSWIFDLEHETESWNKEVPSGRQRD
ncbi:MAG: DUF2235 domain-containing protein [Thermoplasmata archaeon]|nr:MAG: DUF2235 domain-containing protein [Thermoplasmata archaeon]